MWNSRPPPFMEKTILNFHFDYLTPSLRNLSIGNRAQLLPQEGLQVLRGSMVEDNQQVLMLEVEGFRLLLWPGTQRPMVRSQPTV